MTIVALDADGLAQAAAALRGGDAVCIPFPTPLPYAVAAVHAEAVNAAKGRPRGQPCGILLGDVDEIGPHLDLDAATVRLALWISRVERANLFVPVRPDAPAWLRSGAADRLVGITSAWLAPIRPLAREFGRLFVSSANVTGGPVGVTAAVVDDAFGSRLPVLDGDRFRDGAVAHGSATIIEVGRTGALRLARDGINNASFPDPAAYLDVLRRRFAAETARGCGEGVRRWGQGSSSPL